MRTSTQMCANTPAARHRGRVEAKMDHLACFVPGMLALGVSHGAVTGSKAKHYQAVAANLTYTCYQMYKQQPTGVLSAYSSAPVSTQDGITSSGIGLADS